MMFHRTRIKCEQRPITICGNSLTTSKNIKFLGVIIDNKLNWSDHILCIKNKISKSIGIINKTRTFLDKNTLRNLDFTFIYPYLIYCIEIWGNTNDTHLNPIIKIQKKGIRAISFAHYLVATPPQFKSLNILNFKKLVIKRIALLMFKYKMGVVPHPITDLFALNNERHNYNTRQTHDLQINAGRVKLFISFLAFMGYIYGIIYPEKFQLMYHTLVLKT